MSLLSPENALDLVRGESRTIELAVFEQDSSGDDQPLDLTGGRIVMTVKEEEEDREILIQKTSDDSAEVQITNALAGEAEIYLLPGDTSGLEVGTYVFDTWVETASGDRYQVVRTSEFRVNPGVTKLS